MAKIKSTTQGHLEIADIKDNIIILVNGGACVILKTNAINFDLLSIQEQDAAISSFGSLLNSLTFPMQITLRSKKMDISAYLERIKEYEDRQTNSKIQQQIRLYRSFIQDELVTKEEVLDKDFYITVPYKLTTIGSDSAFGWINDLIGVENKPKSNVNVDSILHEAKADLSPKTTFLIKELARMGLKSKQLTSSELIKLFYDIYNSESSRSQRLQTDVNDYTSVLVEPKVS